METDRRPKYVWGIVIVINAFVALAGVTLIVADTLRNGYDNPLGYFFEQLSNNWFGTQMGIALGVSLLLTVVPVLISKAANNRVRAAGYGLPILLLLPIPYFIYDYYTCKGKMCELGPFLLGWGCIITAAVFALFYTIAKNVHKWSDRTYRGIIAVEIVLIVGSLFAYLNYNF